MRWAWPKILGGQHPAIAQETGSFRGPKESLNFKRVLYASWKCWKVFFQSVFGIRQVVPTMNQCSPISIPYLSKREGRNFWFWQCRLARTMGAWGRGGGWDWRAARRTRDFEQQHWGLTLLLDWELLYHVTMPFARTNPKNLGRSEGNTLGMARCYCAHSSGLGGKLGAVAAAL